VSDYRSGFIEYAMACEALRFGSFMLKSGRTSPYFFNAGLFNSGKRLNRLGGFYASAYLSLGLSADVLYGPAYKGIPLACSAAMALSTATGLEIPYAFNRKESKEHGEGGVIVGTPLSGSVLIVDDVITAGTSVRESIEIIRGAGATPIGVLILLDRQERGLGLLSASEEVTEQFGIPVYSVICLGDIISYLADNQRSEDLGVIQAYQREFGIQS